MIDADILVIGEAGKAPDRVVCKNKAGTGTRFMTRTCRTAGQWHLIRENHIRAAREMIDSPKFDLRR